MKKIERDLEKLAETLTPKQAKFLSLWLEHGNGTRAALEAYDCKSEATAAEIAVENLRKLKNPMKLFLEHHGAGLGHLGRIVMDASSAVKADITGAVHPDHKVRLEAADRLSKWLEVDPKVPDQMQQTNIQVTVTRGE